MTDTTVYQWIFTALPIVIVGAIWLGLKIEHRI